MEASSGVQDRTYSFGYWLRRRRKALDLTQEALAQRVSCSGFTIRKIEADERRPSRQLADRLAQSLALSAEERRAFLDAARAVRAVDRLQLEATPVDAATHVDVPGSAIDPASASEADSAPFVGRSNEYGLLIGLIARLTAGTGCTVLIEGEPGTARAG
jgi:transcriptional regulator with XRE-family HTH domain